jgi:hypothetical protein
VGKDAGGVADAVAPSYTEQRHNQDSNNSLGNIVMALLNAMAASRVSGPAKLSRAAAFTPLPWITVTAPPRATITAT